MLMVKVSDDVKMMCSRAWEATLMAVTLNVCIYFMCQAVSSSPALPLENKADTTDNSTTLPPLGNFTNNSYCDSGETPAPSPPKSLKEILRHSSKQVMCLREKNKGRPMDHHCLSNYCRYDVYTDQFLCGKVYGKTLECRNPGSGSEEMANYGWALKMILFLTLNLSALFLFY